jgi:hypothetical protein
MTRTEGINADAALEACSRASAQFALHVVLRQQVFRLVGDMQEAVNQFALFGARTAKLRMLGREPVRLGDGVGRWAKDRMIDRLSDLLAHIRNVQSTAAE